MKTQLHTRYVATPAGIFVTCLIILIAVTVLQVMAIEISREFSYERRRSAATEPEKQPSDREVRTARIQQAARQILPDGSIHIVSSSGRMPTTLTESGKEQIFDVNENLLWEGPRENRPYEYLSWANQLYSYGEAFAQVQMRRSQIITPEFSRTLEIPVGSPDKTEQLWRYNSDSDIFTGYTWDGERIGYAGSKGFTDSKSQAKRFGEFRLFTSWAPSDSYVPTLLWQTRRRIYQINFARRQVKLLFESAAADIETISLHAWRDLKPDERNYVDPEKYRPLLHCTTEDGKHHLIMRNPNRNITFAAPEEWKGWINSNIRFTATGQDVFLRRDWVEFPKGPDYFQDREHYYKWASKLEKEPKKHGAELYRLDDEGNIDLVNRCFWTVPARSNSITVRVRPVMERCVTQFSPPAYGTVTRLLGRNFWTKVYSRQNRDTFFYALAMTIPELSPPGWFVNIILSAAMAGFVFWHGRPRMTSWAGLIFWLVFVAAFNLAGLLTYLALNYTAVTTCPACGRRRGLGRVECAHCQAPMPVAGPGKLDLIFEA